MPITIIGLSGKRGVGKTTMANYLHDVYKFKRISFADRLKEVAKELMPFQDVHLSTKGKEKPFNNYDWTPREFLIQLGQFMRYYDKNYWVRSSGIDNAVGRIVIDDVRFPNEVEYLKSLGAKIVRIKRFEKLNVYGKELDDPSETSLDNFTGFDFIVEDCVNVTLKDMYKQADIAMDSFGIKQHG